MKWKTDPGTDLSGFLDRETTFKGDISFKETLRIDGRLEGTIRSGKSLIIGESAEVSADIEVESLYVSGRLRGTARASNRVELGPTARVHSDITTRILVVEEGAVFEGRCSMKVETGTAARAGERPQVILKEVKPSN